MEPELLITHIRLFLRLLMQKFAPPWMINRPVEQKVSERNLEELQKTFWLKSTNKNSKRKCLTWKKFAKN